MKAEAKPKRRKDQKHLNGTIPYDKIFLEHNIGTFHKPADGEATKLSYLSRKKSRKKNW